MSDKIVRTVTGTVVSDVQDKTIVVKVERKVIHPVIGKVIKRSAKMHAHDESNTCKLGDLVTIRESRPLSKKKTWILDKVVKSAAEAI